MDQNNFGGQPNMNLNMGADNDQTVLVNNDDMQNNYIQPQEFNNQGMAPNMNQGFAPDMNQGFAPDMNQGFAPDMNQGFAPDMNQGMAPNMNQGMAPDMNQGMAPDMNQGFVPDMNQGFAPDMNQGFTPDMNQGFTQDFNQNMNQDFGFGNDVPFNGNPENFNPNIQFNQPANPAPAKPKKKKKVGLIIALVVFLVLAGGGAATYFLFFTPEKRVERKIDKANEALEDGDYETAHELFVEALEIDDDNLEAMVGDINALIHMGDGQLLEESYCAYLAKVQEYGTDKIEDHKEDVLSMYYYAGDVYAIGDPELISIYEEAYNKFPEEPEFGNLLVKQYLALADEAYQMDDFEAGIDAYENALSYDPSNQSALDGRRKLVQEKIDGYMAAENYDDAEATINRFKGTVDGIDYDSYLARIETERYIIEMKHQVMTEAESYMSSGNYSAMLSLDGSEEANFVSDNIFGHYLYISEGSQDDYSGTAVAMYNFGNGGYYFYYGEFVNGQRCGYGEMFMMTNNENDSYQVYQGYWDNDLPNGEGTYYRTHEKNGNCFTSREDTGYFTNGYADGYFDAILYVEENGETDIFTGNYDASMGIAPDVQGTTDWNFNVPSDYTMYVVYENADASSAWAFWYQNGSYLGINPFNKE